MICSPSFFTVRPRSVFTFLLAAVLSSGLILSAGSAVAGSPEVLSRALKLQKASLIAAGRSSATNPTEPWSRPPP